MTVAELFNGLPYLQHLGIELTEAEDGYARGELELTEELSSVPGRTVAHGGVIHSLADSVGGAAVISLHHRPTPTIDIRFDHLSPGREDLVCEATVVRNGDSVATVDAAVEDVSGTHVASARGVYKTGAAENHDDTAWGVSDPDDVTSLTE